jgi:hypothetical protein
MDIPRPERPHGPLGKVRAHRPQTSSMSSEHVARPTAAVPTVQTQTKPSRKKSIYTSRSEHNKPR